MNSKTKCICAWIGFVLALSIQTLGLTSFPGAKGFGNVATGGRGGAVGSAHVTVQNCILADPIGQQFAAHIEGDSISWWRNLFANAHNRCPLAKANTQYVNNVVYDYQAGYTAGNSAGEGFH